MAQHRGRGNPDPAAGQVAHASPSLALLFAGVLLPLLGFGYVAYGVTSGSPFDFDRAVLLALHRFARGDLDRAMIFFSHVGSWRGVLPVDVAVLGALVARRHARDAWFWIVAVGGASLLDQLAKNLFARTRPDLWTSVAPETTLSFPSGHAMQTMALVAALLVLVWPTRWRVPLLVGGTLFVLVVGISRLYLGVHYPTDVLGGWLASLAWVIGAAMLLRRRVPRLPGR